MKLRINTSNPCWSAIYLIWLYSMWYLRSVIKSFWITVLMSKITYWCKKLLVVFSYSCKRSIFSHFVHMSTATGTPSIPKSNIYSSLSYESLNPCIKSGPKHDRVQSPPVIYPSIPETLSHASLITTLSGALPDQ